MDYVIPLIGEAWDHRRRRHRRTVIVGALVIVAAGLVVLAFASPGAGPGGLAGFRIPSGAVKMQSSAVFSRSPYMGVRCPVPNSIACDRVGLAVWLKRPAYSVKASIARGAFALDWFGDEHRLAQLRRPRRAFAGYLQPAGIVKRLHVRTVGDRMWYGEDTPLPSVWILINYGNGHDVVTHLRVPLNAGWG